MLETLGRLYFRHELQDEMKSMFASIAIRDFAVSMIAIFEPIYIYKIYGSLQVVFLFYTLMYSIYFFAIPLGAKACARYGYGKCMSASIVFAILYYILLAQLKSFPMLLPIALLLTILDKAAMRPSYHASMARFGKTGFRGREVGGLSFLETLAGMTGPLIGGMIITTAGFPILFAIISMLATFSMFPLLSHKNGEQEQDFSYKDAIKRFLSPAKNYKRRDSLAYMGYGEELIIAAFWPVFIFLFLPQLHVIGFLATSASILVALAKLGFGGLSDKMNGLQKDQLVKLNAALYAVTNFLRPFISTWLGIFSINFFSDVLKAGIVHPFFTYVYSAASADEGFLEYGAFYEMSLALGKAIVGLGIFALSFCFVGFEFWFIIFIAAGFWSALYALLRF